jgi:hypothetical protein
MRNTAEDEVCGAVNITTNKRVEFQVRLSDAETEAATWRMANTDLIVSQL